MTPNSSPPRRPTVFRGADVQGEQCAEGTQGRVAGRVAPAVVDVLEVVYVDDEQGDRAAVAAVALEFDVHRLREGAAVVEPGEMVGAGLGRERRLVPIGLASQADDDDEGQDDRHRQFDPGQGPSCLLGLES